MEVQVLLSNEELQEVEQLSHAGVSPAVEISQVLQKAEERSLLDEAEINRLRRERPF